MTNLDKYLPGRRGQEVKISQAGLGRLRKLARMRLFKALNQQIRKMDLLTAGAPPRYVEWLYSRFHAK